MGRWRAVITSVVSTLDGLVELEKSGMHGCRESTEGPIE